MSSLRSSTLCQAAQDHDSEVGTPILHMLASTDFLTCAPAGITVGGGGGSVSLRFGNISCGGSSGVSFNPSTGLRTSQGPKQLKSRSANSNYLPVVSRENGNIFSI